MIDRPIVFIREATDTAHAGPDQSSGETRLVQP
jgi:hypothetical protein